MQITGEEYESNKGSFTKMLAIRDCTCRRIFGIAEYAG